MAGSVAEVSDETFDTVVGSKPLVLVNFSVPWCGHCLAMERMVDALAPEYAGRVRVARVNTDHSPLVTERYGVLGLPTFVLFRGGVEVARLSGTPSKAALRRMLDGAVDAPAQMTSTIFRSPGGTRAVERETATAFDPEALAVMRCELGARPKGAPHFGDVAGALRAVRHEHGALVVDYDAAAADALAAVVAAERLCCPDIGWHLERPDPAAGSAAGLVVRLRVEASPAQLDVMQLLFDAPEGAAEAGVHQ